jgi:hypothetical protein
MPALSLSFRSVASVCTQDRGRKGRKRASVVGIARV